MYKEHINLNDVAVIFFFSCSIFLKPKGMIILKSAILKVYGLPKFFHLKVVVQRLRFKIHKIKAI